MRPTFALVLALACSAEEPQTEPEAPVVAEPTPPAEPEEEELDDEDEEDLAPALGESELDEMAQPDLEAACFAGSTAACDRLGH